MKIKNTLLLLAIIFIAITTSGCIEEKEVKIDSDPQGAKILINDIEIGATPVYVKIAKDTSSIAFPWAINGVNYGSVITLKAKMDKPLKYIKRYEIDYNTKSIPNEINFDMTIPPENIIQINSKPQGMRIEIDEDYIGETPLTITIDKTRDDWLVNAKSYGSTMTIVAYPKVSGQSSQPKIFQTYSNPIPSEIYFDMYLSPVNEPINININKQ